ncbi:hypothetical protein Pla123a_03300 [Posidoniimonas polymericola]|uniref:HEAT repeat protein n=1 Tax=Posidoniimonas polymericola TaxID=2528002 RepID=A0A5C5ZG25_9BACT|nr:hypothetical protein [Posidoniimonas polymericola]TWT85523.1 hypothetical protein Pla123a_03300 [Posidoniimonas polymericola]
MKSLLLWSCLLVACGLATGCRQNPLIDWTSRQAEEMERLTRLFKEIKTPEDADERLEEIRECYQAMTKLKRDAPALFRKHAKDKVLKSTAESTNKRLKRADQDLTRAAGALENRRDFSEPFGSMLRVEAMEFMLATVEVIGELSTIEGVPPQPKLGSADAIREPLRMYREYGTAQVVEVEMMGRGRDAAGLLERAAGSNAESYTMPDASLVLVGPVSDFDDYRRALAEQGDVSEIDPGRRTFKFRPAGGSASSRSIADRAYAGNGRSASRFGGGLFDDDPSDRPSDRSSGSGAAGVADAGPTGPPRTEQEAIIQRMLAQARGEVVPANQSAGSPADVLTAAAEPAAGPDWSRPAPPEGEAAPPLRSASPALANLSPSEQRYLRLAEQLTGENRFAKRTAADKLLEIAPTDIKTKATRQKVARGYRTLLSDADFMATEGESVVRGLEAYAGRHCVPLLINHIATRPVEVPVAVIEAIAKHPSPAGAKALVLLLESLANRDQAADALRQFGPDAEPALLAAVAELDPLAKPIAVELLGEIGTRASVSTLSRLVRTGPSASRAAASDALRRVQDRL